MKMLLALAILIFATFGVAYAYGPDLLADWQRHEDQYAPAWDVRIDEPTCRTYLATFNHCEAVMRAPGLPGGSIVHRSLFIGGGGSEPMTAMRSRGNSGYVSHTAALAHFWNRILTFGALILLLITPMFVILYRMGTTSQRAA